MGGVGEELLAVVVLEDFVGAVFACALEGVADEGRSLQREVLVECKCWRVCSGGGSSYPTKEDAADTLFGHDAAPC